MAHDTDTDDEDTDANDANDETQAPLCRPVEVNRETRGRMCLWLALTAPWLLWSRMPEFMVSVPSNDR